MLPVIEVEDGTDEFEEPLAGFQPGGLQSRGGGLLLISSVGQPESTPLGHVASDATRLSLVAALFRLSGSMPIGVD